MSIVVTKHNAERMVNMNERREQYLEGYCKKEKCSVEEALTHNIVQGVAEEYEKQDAGKISKTEIKAGCGGAK